MERSAGSIRDHFSPPYGRVIHGDAAFISSSWRYLIVFLLYQRTHCRMTRAWKQNNAKHFDSTWWALCSCPSSRPSPLRQIYSRCYSQDWEFQFLTSIAGLDPGSY